MVKHAQTDSAEVLLRQDADQLVVEVIDKGKGFVNEPSEPSTGGSLGLRTIRERLTLFGGQLEVESQPGQGTQATILLPLASPPV